MLALVDTDAERPARVRQTYSHTRPAIASTLPNVPCKRCRKPISLGDILTVQGLPCGFVLVVKCHEPGCKVWNVFQWG